MNKKITHIIICLLSAVFIMACENTELLNPDVEYDEYTVVRAELKAGDEFKGVTFTKTLPLDVSYDINLAELKNVVAYLKVDDAQVIPLHYKSEGVYIPQYSYKIVEGSKYELYARTGNKIIYASTMIPVKPAALSSTFNSANFYYLINFKPFSTNVYGAIWMIEGEPPIFPDDFFTLSGGEILPQGSVISARTPVLPEEYRGGAYAGRRFLKLFAFDKAYQDFFKSRTSNDPVNDAFAQGGGSIKWNVQGEKTIGLFIGVAESNTIISTY